LPVIVTLVALAAALYGGRLVWRIYQDAPWTRDGRVRADIITVAPDVSGAITDVPVKDNQRVKRGELLFQIDPAAYQLARAQAEANVVGARSTLQERQIELQRRERLSSTSITAEALDQARAAAELAQAGYDQAVSAQRIAALNLERTRVVSPVDGFVTNLTTKVGDYATAGKALVAITDENSFFVAAYFEETRLRYIHPGDPASIRLMGYDEPLEGHVDSIARATADRENVSGTDLIANVNPTFTWVRLAQRIPVRIAIDRKPDDIPISAGMTATVVVEDKGRAGRVRRPD
jgi:RND family efflux transporter MFP subunit